ncbi:hypothetical protein ACOTJD_25585 [Achromobacter xylosoxidans]
MKQSDLNHLRRLLGWVRCDIGQDPAAQQQTMIHIAGKLGIDSIDSDAKARLVEGYRRAEAVPVYVRDAVKALEKALAAAGSDPGVVAPRATAKTRANTGFTPGVEVGREPVLDDVQIEHGLAEIGIYVWGQRGEDWLAGVEYAARLLRAGDISPVAKPLQNHPDAAAKGVACRDTPGAPPARRRGDTGGLDAARRDVGPDRCKCSLATRLTGDGCRYCQPQTYIDTLEMCAADNLRTIEQLQGERAEQARLLGAGGERELALMARIDSMEAARLAYASEFPSNENGDPDVGSIHQNIRALKARLAQVDAETEARAYARSAVLVNLQRHVDLAAMGTQEGEA